MPTDPTGLRPCDVVLVRCKGRLRSAFLAMLSVGCFWTTAGVAQTPPLPWPQPGDTHQVDQTVDTSLAIDFARPDTALDFGLDFLLPIGDTSVVRDSVTKDSIGVQIRSPYQSWNSWDVPPGSRLDSLTGQPGTAVYSRGNYPLTNCPWPADDLDCTTGGGISGRTHGAVRLKVELTPGLILGLDTLHYDADVQVTLPSPGSFRPGDTITIGFDARLDSVASFAARLELDTVTIVLKPFLSPFSARLSMRTCLLGSCVSNGRQIPAQGDSLGGDSLVVGRGFDPGTLAARGLGGSIRLPQIAFTGSRVENGRRITVSGDDVYAALDWDLDQFLCGGCLSGTLNPPGATVRYTLLDTHLHSTLRFYAALTVEPTIDVGLDFGGVALGYVIRDPNGTLVDSGTGSSVSFALGNSLGLIMRLPSAGPPGPLTLTPSITIGLPKIDYDFRFISGPLRVDRTALSARFVMPPASVGPFSFAGANFLLGPAYNVSVVSDSATTKSFPGTQSLAGLGLQPIVIALPAITLPQPQLPKVVSTRGAARPGVQLPVPSAALEGGTAALHASGDDLSQTITVRNVGNVHLADIGLDYALRTLSDELVSQGTIDTGDYLRMLDPVDFQIPLEVGKGREYRLGVTARAETPIGTLTATLTEWTLGVYEMELGTPVSGELPVRVYSSAELDVRRIDGASMELAGVPATDWSWTTVEDAEALVLRFPLDEVVTAARNLPVIFPQGLVPDELVQALLGLGPSLSQVQSDLVDRQGNDNGRLDIGDVRAYLEATGELPAPGGSAGVQIGADASVPVMVLLTGLMDGDQAAYGLDILLLTGGN